MFTLEWSKKWGGDEREERLPRIADFPSTRIANDEIRPRNFNTVQDLTSTTPRQSSTVARLKKVFCGHNITLLILSKFFKLCWKRTTRAAAIVWSHITSSARFFCLKEKVFTICSVLAFSELPQAYTRRLSKNDLPQVNDHCFSWRRKRSDHFAKPNMQVRIRPSTDPRALRVYRNYLS